MVYLVDQPPQLLPSITFQKPQLLFPDPKPASARRRLTMKTDIFSCMNHTNGVWDFSQMAVQPLIDGIKLGWVS